jgi:hypothetical protein
LAVATAVTDVEVGLWRTVVAAEQIKVEEKQRGLGVLPNFYVSYAVPLTSKQKFKLAGRTVMDPFTFVFVGGAAGVEQAQNHFRGYGQGAQGYAKRFGAGSNCTFSFLRPGRTEQKIEPQSSRRKGAKNAKKNSFRTHAIADPRRNPAATTHSLY